MRTASVIGIFLAFSTTAMAGEYDFCVERRGADTQIIRARFKYGDIDPGKEVARVIVSQRYRRVTDQSVGVSDYNETICGGRDIEEMTVSASAEQLQQLGNAVGRGDVPGAAVIAVDIAAGATVSVVKEVGKAGGGLLEGARDFVCGVIGC